jgi:hypothetical protein
VYYTYIYGIGLCILNFVPVCNDTSVRLSDVKLNRPSACNILHCSGVLHIQKETKRYKLSRRSITARRFNNFVLRDAVLLEIQRFVQPSC